MFKSETKIVTRYLFLALVVGLLFLSSVSNAATITTITVKEKAGVSTTSYPLTFGLVFSEGAVTGNVYLNNYPTQTDVKTTYSDGSIRFAVISALVPMTANSDTVLNVNTTGTAASTTPMTKTQILATDIGATIDLTGLSGSGYSGNLQADLRATINAASSLDYWLEGGVCTEVLLTQTLNNSLDATWEVRFYPGTSYIRISHAMENVNANYRGDINYAVEIKQGNASPTSVYTKASFQHNINSRWRKVLWLGNEPPEVEIHYDVDYIISTKSIPNYDTNLTVPETTIASEYSSYQSRDHDLVGNGLAEYYFPQTGGREDIGPLPTWTVRYLLTMDNRLREAMLGTAEMTAGCPMHYKEYDNTKSFYGHAISIDDRTKIWTDEYQIAHGYADGLPEAIGSTTTLWGIDRAHQGSFNYIPYLITGEFYYLQEMYYWAAWDFTRANYNSEYGRDYAKGLIRDQIRGEAWAFRNILHAASFARDGDIEKAYFEEKIANNITQWKIDVVRYPLRHWGIDTYATTDGCVSSVNNVTSAWQEDFISIILSIANELGYDVEDLRKEHSKFVIGRFTDPDFNWYNGAKYRFPVRLTDDSIVQTWSQARSLYIDQPTSLPSNDYPDSYRFNAMAALSFLTKYPNGGSAYIWLKTNTYNQDRLNEDPTWAIKPRGPNPPVGLTLD